MTGTKFAKCNVTGIVKKKKKKNGQDWDTWNILWLYIVFLEFFTRICSSITSKYLFRFLEAIQEFTIRIDSAFLYIDSDINHVESYYYYLYVNVYSIDAWNRISPVMLNRIYL